MKKVEIIKGIVGCYVSSNMDDKNGSLFREYIWGENGLCMMLKSLDSIKYGNELNLILFQFYINPNLNLRNTLRSIENYRKKEKSIGVNIVIDESNFFNRSDNERKKYLQEMILTKIEELEGKLQHKKLDTDFSLLMADISQKFSKNNL